VRRTTERAAHLNSLPADSWVSGREVDDKDAVNLKALNRGFIWGTALLLLCVLQIWDWHAGLDVGMWIGAMALLILLPFSILIEDEDVWAWFIIAYELGAIILFVQLLGFQVLHNEFIAAFVFAAVALPLLVVYLANRRHGWAIIPVYTLLTVALLLCLVAAGILTAEFMPAYVLVPTAFGFIAEFFWDRSQWWAFIPAAIMIAAAAYLLLA
jgi:hypothetical protein